MIVSALFRTASTNFCWKLAQKLDLEFVDEVYDPLNEDVLLLKRINHEFKNTLKRVNRGQFKKTQSRIDLWKNHSQFLINNHNYDIPWFEAAQLFYFRTDLVGALSSMYELILRSKQPGENIWIYADWMRRMLEYVLLAQGKRPLVLAEKCGYKFRSSGENVNPFVQEVYSRKIAISLEKEFISLCTIKHPEAEEIYSYFQNNPNLSNEINYET